MDKTILQIIQDEDISTLYQPIVNLITGEIMGYEALSRGPEWSQLFSPINLIREAENHGLAYELEFLMRKMAFKNMNGISPTQKLFVNINPSFMKKENAGFGRTQEMLNGTSITPKNVVFELTEHSMIHDYSTFNSILEHYRKQDYKIAIDDVGAGYSGLRTIREIKPDYIKVDMELIRDIDKDSFKEALISAFVNFSNSTNIQLIAEGIETESELCKLINMGVHFGQGYFLQRPHKEHLPLRESVLEVIQRTNAFQKELHMFSDTKAMIGNITCADAFIDSNVTCERVKELFETNQHEGVVIIEGEKPIGILMRDKLLTALSNIYGFSLYSKKKVSHIMDETILLVDYHTTIQEVSQRVMARDKENQYDIIVVTKNGKFHGSVTINSLLKSLLEVETQIAKELNPLSRLPGNSIIQRVLTDLVNFPLSCCIVYLDLDDFKPYNDCYGFDSGDQVLKGLAEIIKESVRKYAPLTSFVGHIGGDDFLFVMESPIDIVRSACELILTEFEQIKYKFFSEEDFARGTYESVNRQGERKEFELVAISMAGVSGDITQFHSINNLSKYMSDLKKKAKSISGNTILIETLD
jgi:EAL domain-containing protein (putative c-di-GMP-specific phosphodiesterase class I)/GGDEF domain-containing protein